MRRKLALAAVCVSSPLSAAQQDAGHGRLLASSEPWLRWHFVDPFTDMRWAHTFQTHCLLSTLTLLAILITGCVSWLCMRRADRLPARVAQTAKLHMLHLLLFGRVTYCDSRNVITAAVQEYAVHSPLQILNRRNVLARLIRYLLLRIWHKTRDNHTWLGVFHPPMEQRAVVTRPQRAALMCVFLLANLLVVDVLLGSVQVTFLQITLIAALTVAVCKLITVPATWLFELSNTFKSIPPNKRVSLAAFPNDIRKLIAFHFPSFAIGAMAPSRLPLLSQNTLARLTSRYTQLREDMSEMGVSLTTIKARLSSLTPSKPKQRPSSSPDAHTSLIATPDAPLGAPLARVTDWVTPTPAVTPFTRRSEAKEGEWVISPIALRTPSDSSAHHQLPVGVSPIAPPSADDDAVARNWKWAVLSVFSLFQALFGAFLLAYGLYLLIMERIHLELDVMLVVGGFSTCCFALGGFLFVRYNRGGFSAFCVAVSAAIEAALFIATAVDKLKHWKNVLIVGLTVHGALMLLGIALVAKILSSFKASLKRVRQSKHALQRLCVAMGNWSMDPQGREKAMKAANIISRALRRGNAELVLHRYREMCVFESLAPQRAKVVHFVYCFLIAVGAWISYVNLVYFTNFSGTQNLWVFQGMVAVILYDLVLFDPLLEAIEVGIRFVYDISYRDLESVITPAPPFISPVMLAVHARSALAAERRRKLVDA